MFDVSVKIQSTAIGGSAVRFVERVFEVVSTCTLYVTD